MAENVPANTQHDPQRTFQVVVPATRDMGIGKDGKLPWKLPLDMKFFKEGEEAVVLVYTFSAWIQVSEGNVPVNAVFKTATGLTDVGTIIAKAVCWYMMKGGFTVDVSGPAELYFESKYTKVDIWVDSVSLQPFTKAQWRAHQEESIQKVEIVKGEAERQRLQREELEGDLTETVHVLIVDIVHGYN